MRLLIKQYINRVVRQKAKIGFDQSVKQWYGILHHSAGSIYSQRKRKSEVRKELAEILEEFIALYLERNKAGLGFGEAKDSKIQGAYR